LPAELLGILDTTLEILGLGTISLSTSISKLEFLWFEIEIIRNFPKK